jgi:aryl-alcohol dehydrogenase-like predicted oxidoreductase/Pyruvate/2-oxoacid:ferredoxin oxidoreductase delta subunit
LEQVKLGKTKIEVTRFGMGVLPIGASHLNLPVPEGAAVIRRALELGVRFFDTAEYYRTYDYMAQAFAAYPFSDGNGPVISSKSLARDYAGMRAAVEEARRKLHVDKVDIFLLHEVRGEADFRDRSGAWRALGDCREEGLVQAIGISTHHVDTAELNAKLPESDVLFALINKDGHGIRRGDGRGTRADMEAAILTNHEAGKGVYAMKVLAGGLAAGRYGQMLDYAAGLPGLDAVMLGLTSEAEAEDLAAYAAGTLPKGYAPDVAKKQIHIVQGDCEACGSCIVLCPARAIKMHASGDFAQVSPELCVGCGYCAIGCPVRAIVRI